MCAQHSTAPLKKPVSVSVVEAPSCGKSMNCNGFICSMRVNTQVFLFAFHFTRTRVNVTGSELQFFLANASALISSFPLQMTLSQDQIKCLKDIQYQSP